MVAKEGVKAFIVSNVFLLDGTEAFGDRGLEFASAVDIFFELGVAFKCLNLDFLDKLLLDVLDGEHVHLIY